MSSSSISQSSSTEIRSSSSSKTSSSSSNSSSKSTSSISTSSTSSSSKSSATSLSTSSTSKSTSSSSSSIDSSSTSSESVGNVSSSSSSSFGGWNKSKPLILGMSAINSTGIINKLAQTISIIGNYYSIGKVFCYFYGPYGFDDSFTIHLDVCLCNDDGEPTSIISSKTLFGSNIAGEGWYSFEVDLYGETPLNKYLSFVIWQEGGNEDDYVLWGHSYSSVTSGTKAIFTNNDMTWQYQEGIIRSLKLIGNFNAYDLEEFKIITPPAEIKTIIGDLANGEFDRTKYEDGQVVIDYPKFIASFVVDASGSMGWNDRFKNRIDFIKSKIQSMQDHYPSEVIFDIVKFGSQRLNTTNSASEKAGFVFTIDVNLAKPSRKLFSFITSSANAFFGDIYENNSYSFTVSDSIVSGGVLVCYGNSSSIPFDSGELTLLSGSGDATISFGSYNSPSSSDRMIAYGFKNFPEDDPCNLADVSISALTYENSLKNWQTLSAGGETELSMGYNGPKNSLSLDFVSSENLVLRRPFSTASLAITKLSNNATAGDTSIEVDDSTGFVIGNYIDIVDKDLASVYHQITDVSSNTITIFPSLYFNIRNWINNGGIIQESSLNSSKTLNTITSNILLRDPYSPTITFFLQTEKGLSLEYDIELLPEWMFNNLFYIDETAILPIEVFDVYGDPFPDGTKMIFYVGGIPDDKAEAEKDILAQNTEKNISIGDDKIYVPSTADYYIGLMIDVINNLNEVQTVEIIEIGKDNVGNYILIYPSSKYNFNVSDGSRIVQSSSTQSSLDVMEDALLGNGLSIVDVTPIYAGVALDPILAKPYDITPTDPNISYDDLNSDKNIIRNSIADIPSISGISSIRILPITEDVLKTLKQKNWELSRLLGSDAVRNYENKMRNYMQNGDGDDDLIIMTTTTTTTASLSRGEDYNIVNPVYLSGGHAQTEMTTFSTELQEVNEVFYPKSITVFGEKIDNTKLVKRYDIYPSMILERDDGRVLAKQYFSWYTIYFASPYFIYSKYIGEIVPVIMTNMGSEECPRQSNRISKFNGVYATGNGFKIKYEVKNKNKFANNEKLKIRIYSNTVLDTTSLDLNLSAGLGENTRQDFNATLSKTTEIINGVEKIIQPLTEIDEWRSIADSNQFGQPPAAKKAPKSVGGFLSDIKEKLRQTGAIVRSAPQPPVEEIYWTNPLQWTRATQFKDLQETTIDIIDGEAILEIPSSEIPAILNIQASMYFGENNKFEFIRSDIVLVENPIGVGLMSPKAIFAEGKDIVYEIGTPITWAGGEIADNVLVSYVSDRVDEMEEGYEGPGPTSILPSDSKTDNGWAGGVRIGPHSPVEMICPGGTDLCEECMYGEFENIKISISYLGYTRIAKRVIEWIGPPPEDKDAEKDQKGYFYIEDSANYAWSDNSMSTMKIDIKHPTTIEWLSGIGPDGERNTDRIMGYEQKFGLPNIFTVQRDNIFNENIQSQFTWIEDTSYVSYYGFNQNIGHPQQSISDKYTYQSPWEHPIEGLTTSFRYLKDYVNIEGIMKQGSVRVPMRGIKSWYDDPSTGNRIYIYPTIQSREPLSISLSLEGSYFRDGNTSVNIIAEIMWEGSPLNGKFVKNDGKLDETIIDYPFPNVTFKAGTKGILNSVKVQDVYWARDSRGNQTDYLTINDHASVSLSSYSAVVGLYRTTIDEAGGGTHTHACNVDYNGNGITNETIYMSGSSVDDHEHIITNYVVSNSEIPFHGHGLRSVAITRLNPTTNGRITIAINGYVVYDPNNCQPYSRSFGSEDSSANPLSFPDGNRMMFSTLLIDSSILDRRLVFDLILQKNNSENYSLNNAYTAISSTDTDKGVDAFARIYYTSYSVEDYPGHWIIMPEQGIPDGTRVTWDIKCYRATGLMKDGDGLKTNKDGSLKTDGTDADDAQESLIIGVENQTRNYMVVKIKVTVCIDGVEESEEKSFTVRSNLAWFPSVYNLLIDPTNDDIYIQDAMSKIDEIGASQIHDAIKLSAQRTIQYQTDNPEWKYAKKAIFLLTDGGENTSEYSINQAIDNVNYIDGNCEVPVIPVRLGFTYGSDDVILNKYSNDTCGKAYYMINADNYDINNIIDDIITGSYIKNNSGVYSNTIDMLGDNLIKTLSLLDILVPLSGRSLFRYRYSSDMYSWSNWSEWIDTSYAKEFDNDIKYKCRYLQYQVKLFGNENYESPEINAGLKLDYYKAQTFTVFFQPIDLDINYDQYLSSIHITHKANIPSTSSVNYGYTQFNSIDINDYSSVTRPWISPDRHTIILTRYNEKMTTKNYKKYTAINGGWADGVIVEIYRVNLNNLIGELISSSEYSINNKTGDITFFNIQNKSDIFVICIYFDPVFRLVCNTVNYGPETATIDHIGVIYNIGKRIPTLNNGTIIHTPISERI